MTKKAGSGIDIADAVVLYFVEHGIQILTAIILFIIGIFIARWLGNVLKKWLTKKAFDAPVTDLIVKAVKLLLILLIGITALGQMGVQITPLIAGIGVAGVGASLAMQGILSNLVAGLTIIFLKPFTIDEYIELLGVYGQVTEISLFSTTLLHTDNSRVVVPNRKIVGEILHNYGRIRQLNLSVGIAYGTDISLALGAVGTVLRQNPRVLKDPAPVIGIASLGSSSITISINPWVIVEDFVVAQAEIYESLLERFRENNIEIPVPAMRITNFPQ